MQIGSRARLAAALATVIGLAQPTGAAAADKAVFGWFLSLPVKMFAKSPPKLGGTGPEGPTPAYPDLIVYLISPVDEIAPHGPQAIIPTPQGKRTLPPHMDILDALIPATAPHDALGYFVIPGPKATAETVRSGPAPADTIVGAPLAKEIRIGGVWVPLTSSVVIQYGLKLGLLDTRYFDYGGLQWAEVPEQATTGPFNVAVTLAEPAAQPAPPGKPDLVRSGWFLGMPVRMNVLIPAMAGGHAPPPAGQASPPAKAEGVQGWFLGMLARMNVRIPAKTGGHAPPPAAERAVLKVYLTGPVRDDQAFTPESNRVPTPKGVRVLPPHDDTLTRLVPPGALPKSRAYFVVPGPKATADEVKVRDEPKDGIVGSPLAYAINVEGEWIPLNNHLVIEYGIRRGLLAAQLWDFDGGTLWTTFDDAAAVDFRPEVTIAP